MIAQTIHHVCDCLRKTIEDIGRILGEMADGNIAVDDTKIRSIRTKKYSARLWLHTLLK